MNFLTASVLVATITGGPGLKVINGMANVPGYGPSRVETVNFCLNESGVDRYQDLRNVFEIAEFQGCLEEQT